MLLLCLILTLVDLGSSYSLSRKCYGGPFDFPYYATPPLFKGQISYTPKGGVQRIVVNDGESKDPRFKVSLRSIKILALTEQDHEAILNFGKDAIKLMVSDCADPENMYYGSVFSWRVPSEAEYLEFSQTTTSSDPLQPVVLWNRTDPLFGRGSIKRNYYEIYSLKQKDSGYYRFRGSDNQLIQWKKLIVQENTRNVEHKEGGYLHMDYVLHGLRSYRFTRSQVLFTPLGSEKKQTLSEADKQGRVEITDRYFAINNAKLEDSGSYEFFDDQDNLVLRVKVEVIANETTWVYVVVFALILFAVTFCWCCVKKRCCKKSTDKRNSPATQTEAVAPAVYYPETSQPTHPHAPTYSYQPVNPPASRGPTVTSPEPPMFNSVMADMSPPPPTQGTAPESYRPTSFTPTSYGFTMSDSEPTFDLKRMPFSAPPLSSDTSISHVYTSDKLNFL